MPDRRFVRGLPARLALGLLFGLAFAACEEASDLQPLGAGDTAPPDIGDSGDSGDSGEPVAAVGVSCELDPVPEVSTASLRMGTDGVLWLLSTGGVLVRYVPTGAEGCAFEGVAVAGEDSLEAIQDVELDAQNRPYVLVFYDEVRRLDPSGEVAWACEVPSGHTLVPAADGSVVDTWPIGAETISRVDAACELTKIGLERAIGTAGAWEAGALVADSFDPRGDLAPGVRLDATTGSVLADLGTGGGYEEPPATFLDLAVLSSGYLGVGSPDGGLWWMDGGGTLTRGVTAEDLLLPPNSEDTISVQSVAAFGDDHLYVAAGRIDTHGVWRIGG